MASRSKSSQGEYRAMASSAQPSRARSERFSPCDGLARLPLRVGHNRLVSCWGAIHGRSKGRSRFLEGGGADRLQLPAKTFDVSLLHQAISHGVDPDHLVDLVASDRGSTDEHGHSPDAMGVMGREGQLVRCRATAADDMDGIENEVIEDRRQIVGRLTETPPKHSTRGAESRALGRDDSQMALGPGCPVERAMRTDTRAFLEPVTELGPPHRRTPTRQRFVRPDAPCSDHGHRRKTSQS